jgi:hypothetical protein
MAQDLEMTLGRNLTLGAGLLLALVVYCLFPGNVDWICDQPILIAKALEANRLNRWGELGIAGGNGTFYGPVPNFIYQVLLNITHDLVNIVVIKVVLSFGMILLGLWRISQDLELRKEGIFFALLSPLIYFYTRSLWDNVFLIPISAIYCSAIIGYLTKRRGSDFALAIASGWLLFNIHLMSLIILVPGVIALNLVCLTKDKHRIATFFLIQAVFGLLSIPYLKILLLAKTLNPYGRPQWFAILGSPVLGARLFGYLGFFEYFTPNFFASLTNVARVGVLILFILSSLGPVCFLLGLKRLLSNQNGFPLAVRWFFISVLIMTVLTSLKMRLKAHPHYMNASWVVYFSIFWKVYSDEVKKRKSQAVFTVYAASLCLFLCVWIAYIEKNSGDRGLHFGPTLKNQIEIARQLPKLNPSDKLTIVVEHFSDFPQRLTVLANIYGMAAEPSKQKRLIYSKAAPSAEIGLVSEEASK